jgi:hypothetical protein
VSVYLILTHEDESSFNMEIEGKGTRVSHSDDEGELQFIDHGFQITLLSSYFQIFLVKFFMKTLTSYLDSLSSSSCDVISMKRHYIGPFHPPFHTFEGHIGHLSTHSDTTFISTMTMPDSVWNRKQNATIYHQNQATLCHKITMKLP